MPKVQRPPKRRADEELPVAAKRSNPSGTICQGHAATMIHIALSNPCSICLACLVDNISWSFAWSGHQLKISSWTQLQPMDSSVNSWLLSIAVGLGLGYLVHRKSKQSSKNIEEECVTSNTSDQDCEAQIRQEHGKAIGEALIRTDFLEHCKSKSPAECQALAILIFYRDSDRQAIYQSLQTNCPRCRIELFEPPMSLVSGLSDLSSLLSLPPALYRIVPNDLLNGLFNVWIR